MQGFFRRCLLLNKALISKLNEFLAMYGLSYSQWTVVYYVKEHGSSTLVGIAKHANVKKPVITRLVQKLEESGIIRQIPGTDRREKAIALTEKGERIYRAYRKNIDDLEQAVLSGIPEGEIKAAFTVLPKVRENVINIGGKKSGQPQTVDQRFYN